MSDSAIWSVVLDGLGLACLVVVAGSQFHFWPFSWRARNDGLPLAALGVGLLIWAWIGRIGLAASARALAGAFTSLNGPAWVDPSAYVLILIGVAIGLAAAVGVHAILVRKAVTDEAGRLVATARVALYPAILAVGVMALAAAGIGGFSYRQAAVVALAGPATLFLLIEVLRRLRAGQGVQIESHWGGIGGGLGGWRLSPAATLVLLAAMMGLLTVGVATWTDPELPKADGKPPPQTPAASAAGKTRPG